MFCPKCGSNLRNNPSFCGNCGSTLKLPNTQNHRDIQKYNEIFAYKPEHSKAATQIAFLLVFSAIAILLWFTGMFSEDGFTDGVIPITWSIVAKVYDCETMLQIFRWSGIFLLVINIFVCSGVLSNDEYRQTQTRFRWSVFTGLTNLTFHLILVFEAAGGDVSIIENFTVWNILFFISCLVLFFLPFAISGATRENDEVYQNRFATAGLPKPDNSREHMIDKLNDWLEAGLITPEEYEIKKRKLK